MTTNTTESQQVCNITVTFPVESDDAAIAVKKKIDEIVKDIADKRVDFRILQVGKPRV